MRLCVFCGSSPGRDPRYAADAAALGRRCAEAGIGIVYGGGKVGLMGALADAAVAAGGEVIGVIPQFLEEREIAHRGVARLHVVGSMHERKATMADLADAFVALPGGFGTYEEFFEAVTWVQLRLQHKPALLANWYGYYDDLIAALDHAVDEGFVSPAARGIIDVLPSLEATMKRLLTFL